MAKTSDDKISRWLFLVSILVLGFAYGYASHRWKLPPFKLIQQAEHSYDELTGKFDDVLPIEFERIENSQPIIQYRPEAMMPGLTLISRVGKNSDLFVEVLQPDGKVVYQRRLNWFDYWADATHLEEEYRPKSPPGTHLHGVVLMDDGGLVFNYEMLGMMRVDACGKAVWRLPQRTHHSLFQDERGHLWVPNMVTRTVRLPNLPYYKPGFDDFSIIEVAPEDGKILREISVFELLQKNNLQGYLYLSGMGMHPESTGDTLHLNDVELFPNNLKPGFFAPGDMMISLRNINAVMVFDLATLNKKYIFMGPYVRQHDPDFFDGNTISVYDNNDTVPDDSGAEQKSRIVLQSAPSGDSRVAFQGSGDIPFYSFFLGKHEWQDNGNILISESKKGRVIEVDAQGELVWEYNNLVEPGIAGMVEEAQRLPAKFDAAFFAAKQEECARNHTP